MKLALVLALTVAACGNAPNTSTDATPAGDGPLDGAIGDDAGSGSGSAALPVVLVGNGFGSVRDFEIGDDAIYPILLISGRYKLVRCPLTGCSATPQVIAEAGNATQGRGVVIAGSYIFWINDDQTIMRAALDGTGVTERYQFIDGHVRFPLRAIGSKLYFYYVPSSFKPVVAMLEAAGTSEPTLLTGTAAQATGLVETLAVAPGKVAYWQGVQGNPAAQPIKLLDLATNTIAPFGTSTGPSTAGFALATSGVAWIESQINTSDVRACLFGAPCDATTTGVPTFAALATYGDRVYFTGRTSDNIATVVTCSIQSLAARTCTPTPLVHPAGELDLLNLRSLKITDQYVYAGTDSQGGGALWRLPRQ